MAKKRKVTRKVKRAKKIKLHKVVKRRRVLHKKPKIKKKSKKLIKKSVPIKIVRKAVIRKKDAKEAEKPAAEEFPAETLFKARIKVVGIGGGGGSIVSEIGRSLQKATFVVADTDVRALKKKPGIKQFLFGQDLTHGLGTGVDIGLAKEAALSVREKIGEFFKDQDIIIFIASLGGGLGSGATQVFVEEAKKFGGITFGIFTLPFKFEGKNKQKTALNALKSLRQTMNVSMVIPNEKIFKIIGADTPITEAFSIVNKNLIESLESLIDLIYNPGIINIDFADLRTILRGRGNSAFLNTVEESGKNRAEKICQKVLFNPLLQNNSFEAEKILFNIAGGHGVSMVEVEKISRKISELNPKAKIIFGISKNSKLKNRIKTTILMTGGGRSILEREPLKILEAKSEKSKPAPKLKSSGKKHARQPKPEKLAGKQPVSFVPVFETPVPGVNVLEEKRLSIQTIEPAKKAIRRSGLDVKRAEDLEEKRRQAQEKEWEIPAFLRRLKS